MRREKQKKEKNKVNETIANCDDNEHFVHNSSRSMNRIGFVIMTTKKEKYLWNNNYILRVKKERILNRKKTIKKNLYFSFLVRRQASMVEGKSRKNSMLKTISLIFLYFNYMQQRFFSLRWNENDWTLGKH